MAVGVAFGALANNPDVGMLEGAVALAIGIGLQNFPEGAAVSIPLRREGFFQVFLKRYFTDNYRALLSLLPVL